jgi:hypothetical protein
MTDVVALEVAEKEFERFLEAMDLEVDSGALEGDDRKSFESNKRKFVRAVQRGQLVVNDNGEPVYTMQKGGTPITFHEPTGATLMALDTVKKDHDVQKAFAVMAEMTKMPRDTFAKMLQRDLAVCQAVFILFLAPR